MRISDWSSDVCSSDLAKANINVDMIIQNIAHNAGSTDVTFTVPQSDLVRSIDVLEKAKGNIGYDRLISDDNVAKISVVGVGMRRHAGEIGRGSCRGGG